MLIRFEAVGKLVMSDGKKVMNCDWEEGYHGSKQTADRLNAVAEKSELEAKKKKEAGK